MNQDVTKAYHTWLISTPSIPIPTLAERNRACKEDACRQGWHWFAPEDKWLGVFRHRCRACGALIGEVEVRSRKWAFSEGRDIHESLFKRTPEIYEQRANSKAV